MSEGPITEGVALLGVRHARAVRFERLDQTPGLRRGQATLGQTLGALCLRGVCVGPTAGRGFSVAFSGRTAAFAGASFESRAIAE